MYFILTQGENKLININQVEQINIRDYYINAQMNGHLISLGSYESEARVKEVFKSLILFINNKHYEHIMPNSCGRIDGAVFEMPKK